MRPAQNDLVALDRWILSLRWRDKLPLILSTVLVVSGIVGWITMQSAAMIGGIFTSFLLELLVYPVIYEIWKGFEIRRLTREAQ